MNICYVANIGSPHIREWLEALEDNAEVSFATIDNKEVGEERNGYRCNIASIITVPNVFQYLPKPLRYAYLGLMLRCQRGESVVYHAHNASGYGLAAWLSGKRYLLTTYGSEIFQAGERSLLYRYLLRWVLKRSECITTSSPDMKQYLERHFPYTSGKVVSFSLGVRIAFVRTPVDKRNIGEAGRPVWFCNRRILPLYRTLSVVRAFVSFKARGGEGTLVLLQGDASGDYLDVVEREAAECSDIRLVKGFVDTETIIHLLDSADFTISVPASDQLSSSILEGMARQCIPILSDLHAYAPVTGKAIIVEQQSNFQHALERIFEKTASLEVSERQRRCVECREEVLSNFSKDNAALIYQELIKLVADRT